MASTRAHQSDLSNFHLSLDGTVDTDFPTPSWSRLGCVQARLLRRSILSSCSFFLTIHHEVLDHRSIRMSWIISTSTICLCLQPCDVATNL